MDLVTCNFSKLRVIKSFSFAEVVITIGIIGIVAAMTLPSLIQKQQKYVLEKNFKVVYSLLLNAIRMAESVHGEAKYWQYYNENLTTPQNTTLFSETYLIPFLNDIHVYNGAKLHGCKNITYKDRSGMVVTCNSVIGFCGTCRSGGANLTQIYLPNGAIIVPMVRPKIVYGGAGGVEIDVDINGYKGPNVFGRDVFRFFISRYSKYNLAGTMVPYQTRSQKLMSCKSDALWGCAAIIIEDGFKFSDEYPW